MEQRIVFILATSESGLIGINDTLPWRIPSDLAFFKKTTLDSPVIMGRKTFLGLPKVLEERFIIVLTSNPESVSKAINSEWSNTSFPPVVATSPSDALRLAEKFCSSDGDIKTIYVAGGKSVFEAFDSVCDEMIVTIVDFPDNLENYLQSEYNLIKLDKDFFKHYSFVGSEEVMSSPKDEYATKRIFLRKVNPCKVINFKTKKSLTKKEILTLIR